MHTVKLDWITPDSEQVIARHARVSTSKPDRPEYERLLKFCIKHGHWSIFEQANASFEIITTRAISPQILRHRTFTFQELSQRYSNPWEVINSDPCEAKNFEMRKQAKNNRQSSTDRIDVSLESRFRDDLSIIDAQLWDLYTRMIEAGVAKECARNICPLYTPTKLHMNGTIRSWAHYVGLRGSEDTQKEHREIAKQIGTILAVELPVVTKALALAAARNPDDKSLQGWLAIHPLARDQDQSPPQQTASNS